MNSYSLDVGPHLLALGALYILLKPILYLLAVGLVVYFGYRLYKQYQAKQQADIFLTKPEIDPKLLIGIAVGVILFATLVVGT